MSMNQSSNFKEICPSNGGISWSMVVLRLDSLCVVCRVSVFCLHGFVHRHLTRLGGWFECYGEMLQFIYEVWQFFCGCELEMLDLRLVNCFLNCWNCSSKSAKRQQVSVSSQYSSDESLSPYDTGWSCGTRCKGVVSWVSVTSSVS